MMDDKKFHSEKASGDEMIRIRGGVKGTLIKRNLGT